MNNSTNKTTFEPFSGSEIGMMSLISVLATLVVASTIYDLIISKHLYMEVLDKSTKQLALTSFSLYSNCKKLFSTKVVTGTMVCLHGLRYLSMFWIILCHTFYISYISPSINHNDAADFSRNPLTMLVLNATVTTDTFLVLSGTLLSYIFLREWHHAHCFNLLMFYLVRYIRLTPPYAFMIFFYATLLYRLGSGPMWDMEVGINKELCLENWWINLLYVNNYINVDRMCMNQTWYLAVDTQLYWASPILLYSFVKWPRFGKVLLGVTLLISILSPAIVTAVLHLPAVMLYTRDSASMGSVYVYMYIRTYTRAGPYVIGITLGIFLHKVKALNLQIAKVWILVGWLVCLISCSAVVLGASIFYDEKHPYNVIEAAIYAGLHRNVWALGIAWIIFTCVKGHGGVINKILSWKLFIPLSRMTYCAYLCHYMILLYNIGTLRIPVYLSEYNILHDFLGNVTLSYIVATLLSLFVEMPFMNLASLSLKITRRENSYIRIQ